ncbi:Anthranilate synthase component 2 (plasmid) [Buchnera aphidicola (Protaphis terricola)]|uniref:anthranilate synthase component II n=1 Tax=Buchnera aphidicola TaxID=9 RepID=UPI0034647248
MTNILLLDNIDSFTYNLVDQLRKTNNNVIIYRNTVNINVILSVIKQMFQPILMLSPGPSTPENAGCMLHLINEVKGSIPIVGICLGHQAIIEAYGGSIGYAGEVFHGRASFINHDGLEMFSGLSQPLPVARYHSLICNKIPKNFIINSYFNNMVMSVRNNIDHVCGFQFHPESILTTDGTALLQNIIYWGAMKYR